MGILFVWERIGKGRGGLVLQGPLERRFFVDF